MNKKSVPFSINLVREIEKKSSTPFYIYDLQGILESVRNLQQAFAWNNHFKEYFAIKALPNPHIVKLLRVVDCGADASSLAELIVAQEGGLSGEEIMFTANNTTLGEYQEAGRLGAVLNLDSLQDIEKISLLDAVPEILCFRFTPESMLGANDIIGDPSQAKFGMTKEQIYQSIQKVQALGIRRFGLHAMLASNELDAKVYAHNSIFLLNFVSQLQDDLNIVIEFLNLGGGIGIPYKEDQAPFDVSYLGEVLHQEYEKLGFTDLKIFMECGRYITGPHGYLVTTVNGVKETYKKYIQVDAAMQNLMRPGMYGAYHHISLLNGANNQKKEVFDVVGSLCENNDKFAIDRVLPRPEFGTLLVIHDAGAHSHSMGFNYNGKLRSAEFLWDRNDDSYTMIRRAETLDDLFSTLKGF